MNNFIKYLSAQAKRTVRYYPAIIAFTLVLLLGVSLILSALIKGRSGSEENTRIKVGIVGTLENSYLEIGVAALQSMDTTRFYIEFEEMTEKEARARLQSGDIKGYVDIPKGFVDSVANGGDMKLTYVMGNSPAVLSSLMMQEIINIIGNVVAESQSAIYGYIDLLDREGYSQSARDKMAEKMAVEYLGKILTREEWYETVELGVGGNLSFEGYYTAAFIIIMFMLWGTVCVNLLTKEELSLQRLLAARGQGIFAQTAAEYLPFFGIFCANTVLISAGAGIILGTNRLPEFLPEISGFFGVVGLGIALLPAAFMISAMQFMLYELTSSVVSAVLLQVLALIALAYSGGLLYPIYSLPETLQKVAAVLPTGVAFDYISRVFTEASSSILSVLIYGIGFLLLAAAARKVKLRGSRI